MTDSARTARRFGRYEVLGQAGRGGMGVVYRALDPQINRIVAIKSISLEGQTLEMQGEYRERFRREAEAAGRLSHPAIVTVFDVGEEQETNAPYIVMEYIQGASLEHFPALETRESIRLVRDLALALDYAHCQGIVHRDIKPANILLTEDHHPKIADFGVVKLNRSESTSSGNVLGTPAYMSPEQLNGGPVDGRSDLFSLGVTLYTLLTGFRPFQGNSALTVSLKVMNHEPVPVSALNSALPSGINRILLRAMAKDPKERYQRGLEMASELERFFDPGSPAHVNERVTVAHHLQTHAGRSMSQTVDPKLFTERHALLGALGGPLQKSWRSYSLLVVMLIGMITAIGQWRNFRQNPGSASATIQPAVPVATESHKVTTEPGKALTGRQVNPRLLTTSRSTQQPTVPLRIVVEPKFDPALLTIWVDERVVWRQDLTVPKKSFPLGTTPKQTQNVTITPGRHQFRVRVQAPALLYDESHTLKANLSDREQRLLNISFGKKNEMKVALK